MARPRRRSPAATRVGPLGEAAEPSCPPTELRESLKQLLAPEVGPAYRCRIVLGIGCLPQQEIAEAHLASRPDDQVEIRQTRCIQVAVDQIFGNLFCSNARGEHALDGSGDLLATA